MSNPANINTNLGKLDKIIELLGGGTPTSGGDYFTSSVSDATTFSTEKAFGFTGKMMVISNDSSNDIEYSFDGTNVHGLLKAGESITYETKNESSFWARSTVGSDTYRIWVW